MLTYGDIFTEFKAETGVDKLEIVEYRPCSATYGVPTIPNAIVVWLKNGARIIYISKEEHREYVEETSNLPKDPIGFRV